MLVMRVPTGRRALSNGGRALGVAVLIASAFLSASGALAQATVFISVSGDDGSQLCALEAPCRTLGRAVSAVAVGGEIRLLDSGDFGSGVIISKSLTLSGNGNSLFLSGKHFIRIDDAGAEVVVRGVMLRGRGASLYGVLADRVRSLHVVDCEFDGFTSVAIWVKWVSGGGKEAFISDTVVRNNFIGIGLTGSVPDPTRVVLTNVHADSNLHHGLQTFKADVTVVSSSFSSNGDYGVFLQYGTATFERTTASSNGVDGIFLAGYALAQIDSSVAASNGRNGIGVLFASVAAISNITLTGNQVGVHNEGEVKSRGSNRIVGNGIDLQGGALVSFEGR